MASATAGYERTALVLDPTFTSDLESLSTEEVRRRRDQTLAERDFQSYLRRLIQARQDLLAQERARRDSGAEPAPLVERLKAVLSSGPAGGSRGEALRLQIPPTDIDEAERRVREMLGAVRLAEPESLADEELDRGLAVLADAEHRVSAQRTAVFKVHDRLQDELKRRYRTDPSTIPVTP